MSESNEYKKIKNLRHIKKIQEELKKNKNKGLDMDWKYILLKENVRKIILKNLTHMCMRNVQNFVNILNKK